MAKKTQILASSAEDCRFWDDGFTSVGTLSASGVSYGDVSFSITTSTFAGFVKAAATIDMAAFQGKTFQKTSTTVPNIKLTSLCFVTLSNKENLLLGTSCGEVLLWDQVWHKMLTKFSSASCRSPVVRVQTNGTAIAAGHENGHILIYSSTSGQLVNQLSLSDSMTLTDLKFSPLKKSLLAATFESGAVALWDILATKNQNSLLFRQNSHQAPASAVALSPINDLLMLSGGLDKKIVFYDCPRKKILKEILADAPVTAVEFLSEIRCFAAGTTKGKIHVYDLRTPSAPVRTFQAHTSAIRKLVASQPFEQQTTSALKGSSTVSKLPVMKKVPSATSVVTPEPAPTIPDSMERLSLQRRRSQSQGAISVSLQNTDETQNSQRDSSLFSPLKNSLESSVPSLSGNLTLSPMFKRGIAPRLDGPSASTSQVGPTPDGRAAVSSPRANPTVEIRPALDTPRSQLLGIQPANLGLVSTSKAAESTATAEDRETPIAKRIPQAFDVELIKRIVGESVGELQREMSQGVFSILWELLNSYYRLDAKLDSMNQMLQDRQALEDEVVKLREENRKLRSLY